MTAVDSAPPSPAVRTLRAPRGLSKLPRLSVVALLISVSALLVVFDDTFRSAEAWFAAFGLNPLVARGSQSIGDHYLVWISPDKLIAFHLTVECTAAVLLIPLLCIGAMILLVPKVPVIRGLVGVALGIVVILITNQLRLGMIAWATIRWGLDPGYEIFHRFVGSAFAIVGFAVAFVVMLLAMGQRRKSRQVTK